MMSDNKIPFEKSFASHEKAKYWSDKNIDNNGNFINPNNIYKCARKDYLFDIMLNFILNGLLEIFFLVHYMNNF